MNQRPKLFLLLFFILSSTGALAQKSSESIDIRDAAKKKMISYTLKGSYDLLNKITYLDGSGQYFGKCMRLSLKSRKDSAFYLQIPCGLMLMCSDTSVQDMIVPQLSYVYMRPGESVTVDLYAMCTEIHDGVPHSKVSYTLGNLADHKLVSIAHAIDEMYMHNLAGQGAVWAYTDEATEEELRIYGANDSSIPLSINVLNKAGAQTRLNSKKEPMEITPIIIDDQEEKDEELTGSYNKMVIHVFWVYAGAGLVVVLSCITLYLLFRRKKESSKI